jgi:hypothetical protein
MVTLMVVDFKEEYGKMVYFLGEFTNLVELLLEVLHLVMPNLKMDLSQIIMDFGEMV